MRRDRNEVTFDLNDVTCVNCDETMIWSDQFREWECLNCGTTAWQEDDCGPDEICFESPDEDDSYYDDIPEGCAACGGDYPNCTSSCPLMED